MKNTIIIICLIMSITAFSQQRERGEKMFHHSNMTSEEMATLKSKKMTLQLDLNKSQQEQVKQLFVTEMNDRKAMMENNKEARTKAMDSSKVDHYKMMNARLDKQIAIQDKMKKILDADQYKKWKSSSRKGIHQRKRRHDGAMKRTHMDSTRTHMRKKLHKN